MFIEALANPGHGAGALRPDEVDAPPGPDARTRDRVLHHVSQSGPITAGALADMLDLTPTAVRRHLDALLEQGDVTLGGTAPVRRGRGRPAREYIVTPGGHRRLDTDYADVAAQALHFLQDELGDEGVAAFARHRFAALERRYAPVVTAVGDHPQQRAVALAKALDADGFAASTRPVGINTPLEGVQLCQGHCPVQRVAAEFPQLCDAETQAFARLLGVHVQRLATQSGGAHVCTTFVPVSGRVEPQPPDRGERARSRGMPRCGDPTGVHAPHAPADPTATLTTPTTPPPADERTAR